MAELTKVAEFVGCEIKIGAEFIGHGIKENTELAEKNFYYDFRAWRPYFSL